jgi:hypothetical protein
MTVDTLASVASISAPIVAVIFVLVLVLVSCRAGVAALGFTLKKHVLMWLDLSIAASLVVFAVCVVVRFKLVG